MSRGAGVAFISAPTFIGAGGRSQRDERSARGVTPMNK